MSDRKDHAAEARTSLNGAEGHYWDESPTQVALYLQKAQAEATLALVEQQRIANLIALGQFRVAPGEIPALRHLVIEPADEYRIQPVEFIRKGLGL